MWVALAGAFGAWLAWAHGAERGLEFLTGYLIEKALAVDNIFVFLLIFSAFAVPAAYVHRVLFWGILGALVMRAVFIVLGAALLEQLPLGDVRLRRVPRRHRREAALPAATPSSTPSATRSTAPSRAGSRRCPSITGRAFIVRQGGRLVATPLLLVLVCIETSDLVFAVDSIPAIFAVTKDPFIVFTSNIFAILGLRSLFFLLAGVMERFHYLEGRARARARVRRHEDAARPTSTRSRSGGRWRRSAAILGRRGRGVLASSPRPVARAGRAAARAPTPAANQSGAMARCT